MHRWLGGTALLFTGLHVFGLLADQYVHFGPVEILVPFASRWHPAAVAWGVVSLYLLLAVELTSLARARISKRTWRQVHAASFLLFVTATLHGLTAGTDMRTPIFRSIAFAVVALVAGFTAIRVGNVVRSRAGAPTPTRPRRELPVRR
jgi:predicted ferric reductase